MAVLKYPKNHLDCKMYASSGSYEESLRQRHATSGVLQNLEFCSTPFDILFCNASAGAEMAFLFLFS